MTTKPEQICHLYTRYALSLMVTKEQTNRDRLFRAEIFIKLDPEYNENSVQQAVRVGNSKQKNQYLCQNHALQKSESQEAPVSHKNLLDRLYSSIDPVIFKSK